MNEGTLVFIIITIIVQYFYLLIILWTDRNVNLGRKDIQSRKWLLFWCIPGAYILFLVGVIFMIIFNIPKLIIDAWKELE